jgi:hypothetical protein
MKKVKFTLSLALSFLLLGAGLNTANAQFPKEKYSIDLKARTSDTTYTVKVDSVHLFKPNTVLPSSFASQLLSTTSISSNLTNPYLLLSTTDSVNYLNDLNIVHRIIVEFPYVGGKEKIAFLSLLFTTPAGTFGGIEVADAVTDKTEFFPSGSGNAVYTYDININALLGQYPNISAIHYEVWIDDEIVNHDEDANGEGNVDGKIPRPYTITLGKDLGLANSFPAYGYISSGKDLIFTVTGVTEALRVKADRIDAASGNPIRDNDLYPLPTVDDLGSGNYRVTIKKVQHKLEVDIVYVSSLESSDTNGNAVIAQDAVWGAGGAVYVNAATPGVLYVYNITGQLVKQESVSGSKSFTLPKGIYIVKFNGKATKVLL